MCFKKLTQPPPLGRPSGAATVRDGRKADPQHLHRQLETACLGRRQQRHQLHHREAGAPDDLLDPLRQYQVCKPNCWQVMPLSNRLCAKCGNVESTQTENFEENFTTELNAKQSI